MYDSQSVVLQASENTDLGELDIDSRHWPCQQLAQPSKPWNSSKAGKRGKVGVAFVEVLEPVSVLRWNANAQRVENDLLVAERVFEWFRGEAECWFLNINWLFKGQ